MSDKNHSKPKVVVENSVVNCDNFDQLKELADVLVMDPYANESEWIRAIDGAIAVIDRKAKLSQNVLESAASLKLIARTGIGVDNTRIHLETAARRGLLITYNPGINSDSVAELTILLALSLYRKLFILNNFVRKIEWNKGQMSTGREIKDKTWGLVGLGRIGFRVAEILHSFGLRVVAFDPYIKPEEMKKRGAESMGLTDLLIESDIVSLHVPLIPSTYHLIGEKELSLMKKESIIINTSRGGIIDEKALYDAITGGKIFGAGLDTLEIEPIKSDNPLLSLENVIITPHIGGSTHEGIFAGSHNAIAEVIRFLKNEAPIHPYPLRYEESVGE
ncbi:MAG: hydroxyacid dehydrogenase [Thermoplasmatales archaeon]|nr:hydroxyacid dehydrogenase [Thermoplasmatales archaeon]